MKIDGRPVYWAGVDDEELDTIISAVHDRTHARRSGYDDYELDVDNIELLRQDLRCVLAEVKLEGWVQCPECKTQKELCNVLVVHVFPTEAVFKCPHCKTEVLSERTEKKKV
jgi:hypothetical protein